MVVFSCDGCGEILKKAKVDDHVYKCKIGCFAVSCVDCSTSFPGGEIGLRFLSIITRPYVSKYGAPYWLQAALVTFLDIIHN